MEFGKVKHAQNIWNEKSPSAIFMRGRMMTYCIIDKRGLVFNTYEEYPKEIMDFLHNNRLIDSIFYTLKGWEATRIICSNKKLKRLLEKAGIYYVLFNK